ncbi:MAG: hypothetical protein HC872_01705 [Gammaproteobacteria bacterium]|nr:hypothetical protein [Gammaproteobacteria bacterium]
MPALTHRCLWRGAPPQRAAGVFRDIDFTQQPEPEPIHCATLRLQPLQRLSQDVRGLGKVDEIHRPSGSLQHEVVFPVVEQVAMCFQPDGRGHPRKAIERVLRKVLRQVDAVRQPAGQFACLRRHVLRIVEQDQLDEISPPTRVRHDRGGQQFGFVRQQFDERQTCPAEGDRTHAFRVRDATVDEFVNASPIGSGVAICRRLAFGQRIVLHLQNEESRIRQRLRRHGGRDAAGSIEEELGLIEAMGLHHERVAARRVVPRWMDEPAAPTNA